MNQQQLTTAEQLQEMNRLVKWVLWNMATDTVLMDRFTRINAEELFNDPVWVANVVAGFATNHAGKSNIKAWKDFVKRLEEQ